MRVVVLFVVVILAGLAFGTGLAAWQGSPGTLPSFGTQAGLPAPAAGAPSLAANAAAATSQPGGQARGAITGTVDKFENGQLTLKTETGTVTLALASDTAIRKMVIADLASLSPGETVAVRGTRNPDGSVTAESIRVQEPGAGAGAASGGGGAGGQGRGGAGAGGGQRRGAGGAGGAGGQGVIGAIDRIDGSQIVVRTPAGTTTVTLAPDGKVLRGQPATVDDLKPGAAVSVQGRAGPDGAMLAQAITLEAS